MIFHQIRHSLLLSLLAGLLVGAHAVGSIASPSLPPPFDELVKVRSRQLGAVYVLPDADFRSYTKVMIDPVDVSFRKDWIERVNRSSGASRRRIDEKDALEIAEAMRSGFTETFDGAFKTAGYEVVKQAAPDVLRLSPSIANIYVNAPAAAATGAQRTYSVQAGEATLALGVRDSTTGALLGLVVDRRETRSVGGLQYTTSVTNRAAFEDLFRRWASICARGLEALKSRSGA